MRYTDSLTIDFNGPQAELCDEFKKYTNKRFGEYSAVVRRFVERYQNEPEFRKDFEAKMGAVERRKN